MHRIAVCLSGQPRTWKIAAPSIVRYFKAAKVPHDNVAVDFFIHTWENNVWQQGALRTEESVDEAADIRRAFEPIAMQVESPRANKKYWHPLFDSLTRSIFLKREHELAEGFEYDVVVKSRLDVAFPPGEVFTPPKIMPMVCHTVDSIGTIGYEYYQRNFNDVMFMGDSSTMDIVTDAFRWVDSSPDTNDKDVYSRVGPGVMLYRHMVAHGIHPTCISPDLDHVIVRKEAQDRALNIDVDYEEVKKIHRSYYGYGE